MGGLRKHRFKLTTEEKNTISRRMTEDRVCRTVLLRCRILQAADESNGIRLSRQAIAEQVGVSPGTVTSTLSTYAEKGLDAVLHIKRSPGSDTARCKTDDETRSLLVQLAASPPPAGKRKWSLRLLSKYSEERLGICLSKDTITRILKRYGPD